MSYKMKLEKTDGVYAGFVVYSEKSKGFTAFVSIRESDEVSGPETVDKMITQCEICGFVELDENGLPILFSDRKLEILSSQSSK